MDEQLIQFACDSIKNYLHTSPTSADTAIGIHQWWIQWNDLPESILITTIALRRLEESGLLERRVIGNQELWRLRRQPAS